MVLETNIHLGAAIAALLLGAVILTRPKGSPAHKALGRVWVGLMLVAAGGSFWIRSSPDGGLSAIHLLSAWTLFALGMAVVAIRRGRVRTHRGWMIGIYCGLLAAGAFALAPGRLLHDWLFG